MVMFDRGVSCTGQTEGGDSDAVFQLEEGASISNVIIGPNQIEGIHCQGRCTLTNVWWSAVCEDAFTVKNQAAGDTTTISGGGAYGAADKVNFHVFPINMRSKMLTQARFFNTTVLEASPFPALRFRTSASYTAAAETVIPCTNVMLSSYVKIPLLRRLHKSLNLGVKQSDVTASNGDLIAGINSNYGDSAKISGLSASGVSEVCERFKGNSNGAEPTSVGTGNDGTYCIIS